MSLHRNTYLYMTLGFLIYSLCRVKSNSFVGFPFRPLRAILVHMFPHTRHFELIMELQQLTQHEMDPSESVEKLTNIA